MLLGFKEEAQTEQFRSAIAIGSAGLKAAILVNGGGVISILTFIGNYSGNLSIGYFVSAMFVMAIGVAIAALAHVLAYVAQIKHLNQIKEERPGPPAGRSWGYTAVAIITTSILLFAIGVILAAFGFTQKI